MDEISESCVAKLARGLSEALGDQLVGVYLHGSAVLGGYNPRQSDLDILVVIDNAPIDQEAVIKAINVAADERIYGGIELSVVTAISAARPSARPRFELHMTTAAHDRKVVEDTIGGDPDLVLHFAACREAGRALSNSPTPKEVFAPVPRSLVVAQLANELTWAEKEANTKYAVLNACRAWLFLDENRLVSKIEGREWALDKVDGARRAVIAEALRAQMGEGVGVDPTETKELLKMVQQLLKSS